MINWVATRYHHRKGYFDLIKRFLVPSEFLIAKMVEAGWDRERFTHLPTFAYSHASPALTRERNRVLYAGRLDYGKGIHVLLEAVLRIRQKFGLELALRIAGHGDEEYIRTLQQFVQNNKLDGVTFVGGINKEELYGEYARAIVSVIPSLYYDNMPNSALESLSCGTPVIAPNHGCFPEIVVNGETGFLYRPGNVDDLASAILKFVDGANLDSAMNENAKQLIERRHSPEVHYATLMSVVKSLMSEHVSHKEIQ